MLKKLLRNFETEIFNFVLEKMDSVITFTRLTPFAFAPQRGSSHSAGLDLRSPTYIYIYPYSRQLILTDLQISMPPGCYARIASRSGLALNSSLDVVGGVVDRDFKGNIGVILANSSHNPYYVSRGDRIAQIIFEKCVEPDNCISFYNEYKY